jgi:uncharacterized protein YjiK
MGEMKMKPNTGKMIASFFLFMFFIDVLSCSSPVEERKTESNIKDAKLTGYDLSVPDKTIPLPGILHEISGITLINPSSVACIQDEYGVIFIFDLLDNEIKDQLVFSGNGDYEGIARVDKTFYVLRSDGTLFEYRDNASPDAVPKIYSLDIPASENEGLCYDKKGKRLLIAPKSKLEKSFERKESRLIYGFDLKSGTLAKEPVYEFDIEQITSFALDNKVIAPEKEKKKSKKGKKKSEDKVPEINLRPSAIGIHPVTNELFVLSSIENMLFIFRRSGTIKHIEKLDKDIFNMPEGITFFDNGDMLISNEGQNKVPTLLRFNYKSN